MRTALFNSKSYDRDSFLAANDRLQPPHELQFLEPHLNPTTARLADGVPAVCAFVNDDLSEPTLQTLAAGGTRFIALRSAGFNHVDLAAAARLGMRVARVPAYSPHAVAEHTVGMMLTLNRKFHKAYNRVREGNFALEGLLGFDMHGRTVGIVGAGKIGAVVAKIVRGLGCEVLVHDRQENPDVTAVGGKFVSLDQLLADSHIITLHCPLMPETKHLINQAAVEKMRPGVMLINTSRGPLVDTAAVISALKAGKIGYLGLDVYEEEADLFFEDQSARVIQDDIFMRLLTFPNVLITGHQAFFTRNALDTIAETTLSNLTAFEAGKPFPNEVTAG